MRRCETLEELEHALGPMRGGAGRIGFVPTMGNLHEGHLSLVRAAGSDTDLSVVSIFVNPFQFGAGEDFETYPRTLDADLERLCTLGAGVIFLPNAGTLYPNGTGATTTVEVPGLAGLLCGVTRPTFFRGVCTVVNILLNIVRPDVAYFGEKDYQQLLVIRRMVRDLRMGVDIRGLPTVRESDGLAMSSRNAYLDAGERRRAVRLHETLSRLSERLAQGERDYDALCEGARRELETAGFGVDYVEVRSAEDLSPPGAGGGPLRVFGAGWLGGTRLIDNVPVPDLQERIPS